VRHNPVATVIDGCYSDAYVEGDHQGEKRNKHCAHHRHSLVGEHLCEVIALVVSFIVVTVGCVELALAVVLRRVERCLHVGVLLRRRSLRQGAESYGPHEQAQSGERGEQACHHSVLL
jgi:hypothetical protein